MEQFRENEAYFSALGLTDGFYQFALEELASYFSLGVEATAGELGLSEIVYASRFPPRPLRAQFFEAGGFVVQGLSKLLTYLSANQH